MSTEEQGTREESNQTANRSRRTSAPRGSKPPRGRKANSSRLLTGLFIVFICIPALVLAYLAFTKKKEPELAQPPANQEVAAEPEKASNAESSPPLEPQPAAPVVTTIEDPAEAAEGESPAPAAKPAPAEEKKKPQPSNAVKIELPKPAESKPIPAAPASPPTAPAPSSTREKQKTGGTPSSERESSPSPSVGYHTVQPKDNLYRIALKYYGSAKAVQKIKDANGLSSDNIGVGQKLKLP